MKRGFLRTLPTLIAFAIPLTIAVGCEAALRHDEKAAALVVDTPTDSVAYNHFNMSEAEVEAYWKQLGH